MNKKLTKILSTMVLMGALLFTTLDQTGVIERDPTHIFGWSIAHKDPSSDVIISTPNQPEQDETITTDDGLFQFYVDPIAKSGNSSTQEGSVKYGARIILGELDHLGRSTYAHIHLQDENEPGYIDPSTKKPREKRNERINVDPKGWRNFKINGNWANNRCHLIGYQFSGLNDELRNLATCTSYLNKGTEKSGTDQGNPDGMLFYEQKLDQWLSDNPSYSLDMHVKPIYSGNDLTPSAYYMQWIGYDVFGDTIAIDTLDGHAQQIKGDVYGVLLENVSPSYNVDTATGIVSAK